MNLEIIFRPASREDSPEIARLFGISSGGVAVYVWGALTSQYPGLTPLEIGARRYAGEEGAFSYKNCTVADRGGEVIGMLHAFPMPDEPEQEEDEGQVDPVLEPYARLEVPGSYYVSGMALFPGHRGKGLGTQMLGVAREHARQGGYGQLSLLVFEQNQGAVDLYRRHGYEVIDRAPVVPHESIRYTGDILLMTAPA